MNPHSRQAGWRQVNTRALHMEKKQQVKVKYFCSQEVRQAYTDTPWLQARSHKKDKHIRRRVAAKGQALQQQKPGMA